MSSLNSALDIAKTALLSSQKAINVTSHNIANANTEGYTRQRASLEAMPPVMHGNFYFGTGVTVSAIERIYDNFQAAQLRSSQSSFSRYESKEALLKTLEASFDDLNEGSGLSAPLDAFFNAFQDLANNPSSYAERSALLSNAAVLTDSFNNIDSTINQNITNINKEVRSQVDEINSLASQIAELNDQIGTVEVAGISANDLRDKRDLLLESLSEIIDISTMENDTGQVDVYVGGGVTLVAGVRATPLEVEIDAENPSLSNVISGGVELNNRITGGSIKGVLDAREYFQEVGDKINLLAATLVKEVNVQHSAGYGLDGSTGVDFFTVPEIYTKPYGTNGGGAVVSSTAVSDLSLVTLDDYEIRFTDAANYIVVNTDSSSVIANGGYTSGNAITFEGLSVTITDISGAPAAGDKFTVSFTKNAAQSMGLDITDPNSIAAASSYDVTPGDLPGDNTNALALAAVKNAEVIEGTTISDYYTSLVSDIGVVTAEAGSNRDSQDKVVEQLLLARDSVSGVSIEEEAINLIKLQRAYQAAAKIITTVDEMYITLLNIR
ncbi:MAG: flagellar hook-associated protein FlgK [Deltaproteobacteria bacterium]